jgi:hypothetical protein
MTNESFSDPFNAEAFLPHLARLHKVEPAVLLVAQQGEWSLFLFCDLATDGVEISMGPFAS